MSRSQALLIPGVGDDSALDAMQSFSGLQAVYRAESVVLSGSAVTQWNDQSGKGRHAIQATADSQPTWVGSDSTFNNRPTLSFDGTDDFLTADSLASILNGDDTPFTLWIVSRFPNLGGANGHDAATDRDSVTFSNALDAQAYIRVINRMESNPNHHYTIEKVPDSTACDLPADTTNISIYRCSGAAMNTYTNGVKKTDGVYQPTNDVFNGAGSVSYIRFTIGCLRRTANTEFWSGKIALVALYNKEMSVAELNTVGRELAPYYGKTWTAIT